MTVSINTVTRIAAESYLPAYEAEAETLRTQLKHQTKDSPWKQLRYELLELQLYEVNLLIALAHKVLDGHD